MDLQKIAVKIFAEPTHRPPLVQFIDVFHGWIRATDGVYHDVADYSHMHAGPGIVLIAPDANLGIDENGHRRGLLLTQKKRLDGSNHEKLVTVLRAALENCRRLEEDRSLNPPIRFSGSEFLIAINDRLGAPNSEDAFNRVKPEIEAVAKRLFAGAPFTLERDGDPRKRLNVTIATAQTFDVRKVLENLRVRNGARAEL